MTVSDDDALLHLAGKSPYIIRVIGDSMSPRIQNDDLLLVDYNKEPKNNDVVVAALNGESMVKRFRVSKGHVTLHSDNEQYAPIPVNQALLLRGSRDFSSREE